MNHEEAALKLGVNPASLTPAPLAPGSPKSGHECSRSRTGFYADLERLELATTARHPYMHTARLFQLTAWKPS
ncbi:hypothetical protein [Streptomyces swartbergensis]|uniref:hypothetical protein n=1 Tax=Streptomyces swartbergensis TaxID=487165 RepID=UPI0038028CA3